MKILLIYPQYPDTFWSFRHALKFVRTKAVMPPLGLLTIAAMLPQEFETRLVDMNVDKLDEKDLFWADYVFISAMITQKDSAIKVVERCKKLGIKTVAGGPLFSGLAEEFSDVDHLVLDEGEVTLPLFLEDLKNGVPKKLYRSDLKPDLTKIPIPKWELINFKHYNKMPIQYSRGCPFDCEFCDVVNLNGRIPRTKSPLQVVRELDSLYKQGWRRTVFIVDDNFIGNREKTKKLLRAIIRWRKARKVSATFMTEVSLNLADDDELMGLMRDAGFDSVFVGLETPSKESLEECGKYQNRNRDLVASVKKLHSYGLEVSAGFIVGFDSDDSSIFKRQIDFIQKTGVVVAMIGMLQALPGTRLYERLKKENRIIEESSGNNTDYSTNFLPKLGLDTLVNGYKGIIASVYSSQQYYERIITFLKDYNHYNGGKFTLFTLVALIKSMFLLGIFDKNRYYYWKLFFVSLFKYPKSFSKAIGFAIYYNHFSKIFFEANVPDAS